MNNNENKLSSTSINKKNNNDAEIATIANGCFWCTEAIFSRVKGIKSVMPGYSGENN
jgi:peptide-methionine (S)-S-oxide reductase